MMKIIFILLLLLVSYRAFAPISPCITIVKPEVIDPYKQLIYAIGMVEGKLDTLAINPVEQAYGYFQVRAIRLEDYNARTGSNYSLQDMLVYEKAERVFRYYASQIGFKDPGRIARSWNGSGPKTWDYWKKVRNYLII
jgi:hypothetical protein